MKRIVIVITFLFIILTVQTFAHSGGTDANGGHNSSSGYHYHHGYPAHSHISGVCPYDYDDNTDHSNNSSQSITKPDDKYSTYRNEDGYILRRNEDGYILHYEEKDKLESNDESDTSDESNFVSFLKRAFLLIIYFAIAFFPLTISLIINFISFIIDFSKNLFKGFKKR